MRIKCPNPKCPDPSNIQRFEMTHATGVSSAYSPAIGLGRDSEGDLVYGLAITRSKTTSKIAYETAPPEDPTEKPSYAMPVLFLFWVILGFFAYLYVSAVWNRGEFGDTDSIGKYVFWLLGWEGINGFRDIGQTGRIIRIVLASGFIIFCFATSISVIISSFRSRKNKIKIYQRRVANWRNSWICLSCGTRWRQK